MNSNSEFIDPPLISVVVPVALGRGPLDILLSWVDEAIQENFHVVVVLDGSPDAFNRELTSLFSRSTSMNLTLLNGIYGSPGAARNAGLNAAIGKWVYFWDSDDLPYIQRAKSMVLEADRTNSKFAVGSFEWKQGNSIDKIQPHLLNQTHHKNLISIGLNPGIWRFAFRRSEINHKFSTLQMAEDQIFLLQNVEFSQCFLTFEEIVYRYHSGIPSQQTSNPKFISDIALSLELTSRLFTTSISPDQSLVARIFILRQFLTALKHGTMRLKLRMVLTGFSVLKRLGISNLFLLFFNPLKLQGSDHKLKDKTMIIVPLTGGLGNQLFQFAAALSLADGKGILLDQSIGKPRLNAQGLPEIDSLILPENVTLRQQKQTNLILSKIFGFMLRNGVSPRKFENFTLSQIFLRCIWKFSAFFIFKSNFKPIAGVGVGYFDIPKVNRRTVLYGYFQSYRWPKSVKLQLQNLTPKTLPPELVNLKADSDLECPLVVHIRLGDYRSEENFGLLDRNYFLSAIRDLWSTQNYKKIWLFSDEPEEAIKYFPTDLIQHIRVISDFQNSAVLTLESMRFGHGYVISNSSFSWWGAFLSHHPNAKVIAPLPWFKNLVEPIDLVPPEWVRKST